MNIEKWIKERGFDVHGGCPGREPQMAIKESDLRALFKDKVLVPPTAPVQNVSRYYPSLTKREAFAMAAMQGFCANPGEQFVRASVDIIAEFSVGQADALLSELAKVQS
jgi:hypothetical protein